MLQSSIILANHVTTLWFSTRPNKKPNFHSKGYRDGHTQTCSPHPSTATSFSGLRTTTRPSFCSIRLGSSYLFPADQKLSVENGFSKTKTMLMALFKGTRHVLSQKASIKLQVATTTKPSVLSLSHQPFELFSRMLFLLHDQYIKLMLTMHF